jgi:hypothetical protein
MDSHGVPGKNQFTKDNYWILIEECIFELRGKIDRNEKGKIEIGF